MSKSVALLAGMVQAIGQAHMAYQQHLMWEDARLAREARERSERRAEQQFKAMLEANPSGQLGNAKLNDRDNLVRAGLL